ncbi:phosphohistidine phosphatase SixA [Cellvibrio mixtus]|uniref:phosphohistidine phosphatase SixA n=1 Tax=Cellvibrio mixtus TaxID=39650 RepID=UPI0005872833|nr:phosphohistidine phosphatase SixA [Cellvibrio mixtus]
MDLFILRHGQAEPQKTTDEVRELTAKGREDTKRIIAGRLAELQSITQVWASPLVRAQQTAVIATSYFPALEIRTSELIIPEASPAAAINWLQSIDQQNLSILLVSHQPFVGELVNKLCGKSSGYYPMGTSSLAAIRTSVVAVDMGELLWLDHA